MGATYISTESSTTKRVFFACKYPAENSNGSSVWTGSNRPADPLEFGADSLRMERRWSSETPAFRKSTRSTGKPTDVAARETDFVRHFRVLLQLRQFGFRLLQDGNV